MKITIPTILTSEELKWKDEYPVSWQTLLERNLPGMEITKIGHRYECRYTKMLLRRAYCGQLPIAIPNHWVITDPVCSKCNRVMVCQT